MTPKEKAEELVNKIWVYALLNVNGSWQNAKECALIAVDEIIEVCDSYVTPYYYEVKQEIEKL
jgi:hypothetical protein